MRKKGGSITGENNVIDIDQEETFGSLTVVDKERGICMRFTETKSKEKGGEFNIPSSRSLFETIHGLPKLADMVWKLVVGKVGRLCHIDFLMKCSMKESIVDI